MTTKVTGSVLANTAVTAGTYGGSTQHAVVTVDAQGRLTLAANATPSIANSQITGVMTGSQLAATAVTPATYGGVSVIPSFTVDQQGRVTFAANATPSIANSQITGVMTGSQLASTAVTPATYGGSTQHSVVTVDQQGRVTFAANATPSIANSQITGVMTGSQLAATAVTPATYGGAATAAVITVDQQGRITSAANATISGGFSNMVVLTSNNASYSIPATKIKVTVVGGGGGGGGGATGACCSSPGVGHGAGGGGTAIKILSGLTVGSTLNITIGAAGTGGSPGSSGTTGGTTSVASGTQTITTISATSGGGGSGWAGGCNTGVQNGTVGVGGVGSGGDLNLSGNPGTFYRSYYGVALFGGSGGGSFISGGAAGLKTGNTPGKTYGGGGSGGAAAGAAGAGAGGAAGVVIIEY